MAFQPGSNVDATTMVNGWKTGVGRSGSKWRDKSLKPSRMFNADPDAAATAWLREVTAAQPDYKAGLANTDLQAMEASIVGPGMAAYQAAGQNKSAKFAKVAPALASAIAQVAQSLPADRSSYEARKARMIAQADGMHAKAGTIK